MEGSQPSSKSIHSIVQFGDDTQQSSTKQRARTESLFEKPVFSRSSDPNSKSRDTYVSDIINIESLLNIRALEPVQRKRNTSISFEDRIIINVCGDRYETHRTTLELYPNTLLGNRKKRKYYYDKRRNEYFFDRNRSCFEAILYYYQSDGRIRRPNYIPIDTFLEEVTFFQLGQEALNQLREDENIKEVRKVRLPKNHIRRYIWATMEYPDYSILAKFVNILSLLMILLSTIALAVESLPQYENTGQLSCDNAIENSNKTNETMRAAAYICHSYFLSPFFIIQTICIAFFTIELLLRIISAPSLIDFIKNIMNWIDVVAVIPYYVAVGIYLNGGQDQFNTTTYVGLRFIRILRFARVFKLYRVFKGVKSLRVLASTLKQSLPDFIIMIIILTLLSFLFGAAAFFAENESNPQAFDSIFKATYWGIMTITSVGYGDISPVTAIGRIISCLCALFGAATLGMLVSVLVDRYQRVFARKLYVEDQAIDFDDYSDEENNDNDSRGCGSGQLPRRNNTKDIEDPDARAKVNNTFETDPTDTPEINNNLQVPDNQVANETSLSRHSSRVHFIISYTDDENRERSKELLESISTVVAQKANKNDNIELNIISNDQQTRLPTQDVKFQVSTSSLDDIDDDADEELTEIISGKGRKGNVLKKFQYPSSSPPFPNGEKS